MKPKDMIDEHIAYMAGNLKGWVDAGGSLQAWASYHALSTEDIITLDARIQQVTTRVTSERDTVKVKDLSAAWVVEWSHSQQAIHIQPLLDSLETNVEMVATATVPDFTIISIWNSYSEAMAAAQMLEPMLRKYS